ncbi:MAG: Chromosome segregation ATPase Smc [Thermodesulfobacterium sp.]|uniref:Chromosome partition protein Smc n=1 Tax=Candidatus Thermodesulfobacterium syntrophicum TaxID=3060442 RepID=A0AAE3TFP9_9BACT|nr:Chromosome segregation ATPase Smc [Candidatus Thermodesulfobacterium syntrophicum]
MFIKRLEIYGFKSFPYKVSIPFSSGITAIVGPNGSGKSNILDAIRWVLGEQSPKKLRIKEFSDLIFSGNSERKIDFTEVKLFLNHEPPVWEAYKDSPEIVITRRFYRDGESEFFINQKPCRMKDIQFLFLDMGVNPQSYGIIEQGEISKFIEITPKERKTFLEDLAGVSRLKITEENTLKNLQKTEENLVRLKDIINEVKLQYEHLKNQAEEAKKYLSLREKLQTLLIKKNLYLLEVNQKEKEYIKKKIDELLLKKQALEREIEKLEREEQEVYQEVLLSERKIKDLKTELQSKENYYREQKENLENLIKQERDLSYKLEKIKLKREHEKEKLNNLNQEAFSIKNTLEILREKHERYNEELEKIKKEKEENYKTFNERLKNFQNFEKEYLLIKKDEETLREKINFIEKECSRLRKEKEINKKVLQDILLNLKKFEEEKNLWNSLIKEKEENLKTLIDEQNKILEEKQNIYKKLEALTKEKQKFLTQLYSLKEKLALIEKILSKSSVSKNLLIKNLNLPSLESYINLDAEEMFFIELVFKENLNAFVIEDLNLIKKLVKENFKKNIILFWGKPEIIKNFSAIEKFDSLSDEVLTSYKTNPRFIYLLKERILLTPYGFIYFIRKKEKGIFSLKKEKEEISKNIKFSENLLKEINGREKDLKSEIEKLENHLKEIEKKVKESNKELQNLQSQKEGLEMSCIKLEERKRNLEEKIEEIEIKIKDLEKEKRKLVEKIKNKSALIEKKKREYETIKEEKNIFEEKLRDLNKKINSLEQEIVKLQAKEENLKNREFSIKESFKKINESLKHYDFNRETLLKEFKYVKNKIKDFNQKIKDISLELSNLKQSIENLLTLKEEKEKILKNLETKKRKIEKELKELDNKKHNLELNLLEKNLILNSVEKELKNLVGEEQIITKKEEKEKLDLKEIEKEIENTRNLLKQFSEVNLASIKEFELVSQRYTQLIKQKEDLELSIREFKKILQEIKEISRERILKTLEEVNKKLEEVFSFVFKSGRALLVLSGDDPLSAGLELKVEIPHKRLKHINMLSGGEKALCALVILISFYLVKPGPFCILDEVDAFLDDKNSLEFIKLLKLIKKTSQIILITHNPYVMKEVDTLLGVTMEEKGISKVFILKKENFLNEYTNH